MIDKLALILQRGAASGVFRANLDPVDVYISISALGFMYVANQDSLSVVFNRDMMSRRALRNRMSTIKDMIFRYMQK